MTYMTRELSLGPTNETSLPRLLVVEDDEHLRSTITRLANREYAVTALGDGASAADLLVRESFDIVLSDIGLPGMSGVDLLRLVRSYDLDVPVVLMTGTPSIETAIDAVELGALTYVTKPFEQAELLKVLSREAKLSTLARMKRAAIEAGVGSSLAGDRLGLEAAFRRALDGLWIAYQPIVEVSSRHTVAYEALMRSTEPTMPHPGAILAAAERLDRLHELGRRIRELAVAGVASLPADVSLFLNLHARDLLDEQLYDPGAPLSKIASRVVLEVTERGTLDDIHDVRRRSARLRDRGFQIAIDDLGAGYAGLTSFATLEPEIVKLDMSLIRGIDAYPVRTRIVETIAKLSRELSMRVVAEGIETTNELRCILDCGCDYLQGFLFGKPERDARPASVLALAGARER